MVRSAGVAKGLTTALAFKILECILESAVIAPNFLFRLSVFVIVNSMYATVRAIFNHQFPLKTLSIQLYQPTINYLLDICRTPTAAARATTTWYHSTTLT